MTRAPDRSRARAQVAKCEKIEEDASALADLRLHEALVAQRCTESRAEHVSRAWQTLVAVGEPGAGSAPELGDAEATREAVREHLLACVHHEEINSLLRIAEREASVAAGCAQNTAEMRAVQRTKVAAKRAQETEVRPAPHWLDWAGEPGPASLHAEGRCGSPTCTRQAQPSAIARPRWLTRKAFFF